MSGRFMLLLQAMLDNPERPIDEFPLLTPAESAQLRAFNNTERAHPRDRQDHRVHQLFEQQLQNQR